MESYVIQTNAAEDTITVAQRLARLLEEGMVLTLEGDLGAGKTTFTKGLATGLGINRNVNSPTFTIIKEYKSGRLPLYHMDVYRLDDEGEDLGFEEYFNGDGVTVVEWAHLIENQLPTERLNITIKYIEESTRNLILTPYGDKYNEICKELTHEGISN
ncbi:tRNA (adenosine(37)-N6)-threonylcarbamoyltransferase complex ATPase subunit type 1 TsaE [Metabacillus malikii]|uniref:tRNA threonylcarbamoyladenosine biosynthesis protein TsaE n=1 Tax=Metabacillus malikii TaxID=1504265 RepID=A0ABT9ZLR9_9BACI|nr:tRNA (adenosine(37)-N6)-threonylcarbamoyltransferase complex ATPase subunit type 1 TsaE [Metabacillus malikii]MDQ0232849.1 tRNA threonylcarbamoyladenosine biosynthesis protein TsaE [Metabacillus malikii]